MKDLKNGPNSNAAKEKKHADKKQERAAKRKAN